MAFEIIISPQAGEQILKLDAHVRARIRDALEVHLRHEPTKLSRSRIKRLEGLASPQYRLRVDHFRILYDATETEVHIIAVNTKAATAAWLDAHGIAEHTETEHAEDDSTGGTDH